VGGLIGRIQEEVVGNVVDIWELQQVLWTSIDGIQVNFVGFT
jgi:hypothetical protein